MIKIKSAGKSLLQGWNDTLASLDEKPGMLGTFTYDYWIDTIEVTQKQFYDYTGRNPVSDTVSFGMGDNYPVYNVTWFDAVLYCNARSKAEKLDTVYVYSGKKALSTGGVYELTGLWADLSKDGYRLPTESEREFAAREETSTLPFSRQADSGTAQLYAWFSSNSDGKPHPVASKMPNALGLYDMAGNVFEWTNDWKVLYNGEGITNSLGRSRREANTKKWSRAVPIITV
jgi:formylglycine-generating enzyme required for sulfatase activity